MKIHTIDQALDIVEDKPAHDRKFYADLILRHHDIACSATDRVIHQQVIAIYAVELAIMTLEDKA